jgi:hypothetical protein
MKNSLGELGRSAAIFSAVGGLEEADAAGKLSLFTVTRFKNEDVSSTVFDGARVDKGEFGLIPWPSATVASFFESLDL